MKKNYILTLFVLFISTICFSQSNLFQTKELQNAYSNQSRSKDGFPGKNYFQNQVDYKIDVDFNTATGTIVGSETVIYTNNSSNSLSTIVIRSYQDFYKKGVQRNIECAPEDLHDGVDFKSISAEMNGAENKITFHSNYGTSKFYRLENPLEPGTSVTLKIDWEFKMPKTSKIRYGTYDESTYFVAYWYPQIAVYDDINRWYYESFYGSQEFYNEFANFDVKITVPGNQVVWATGMLQNTNELFSEKYLERIEEAKNSDEIVHIIAEDDLGKQITKKSDYHTWQFKAENVTDFAFATSDHCLWDGTSVPKIENSSEKVFVSAVYRKDTKDFHQVAEISQQTIDIMSNDVLGIEFPFPQITIFSGGDKGMEFPMMVNDDEFDNYAGTVFVTSHEVSHSYFPFYVGTNEHQEAWLDEGLITFLPKMVEKELTGNDDALKRTVKNFSNHAGRFFEVPLMIPSYALSGYSYNFHAYTRPANAFFALQQLIGEDMFKTALQEFAKRWNGKHPTGYDFFYTVEDVCGEELKWFWEPWFFEFGYPDLALSRAEVVGNNLKLSIEKQGNLPVALSIRIIFDDNSEKIIEKTAEVWKDTDVFSLTEKVEKNVSSVEIGNDYIPDSYPENNKINLLTK